MITQLVDEYKRRDVTTSTTMGYVEIVAGIEGLRAQFESIQGNATQEILGCTKAPLLLTSPATGNPGELRALRRGVTNRWLYERQILEEPGMMNDVRTWSALGEEIRSIPSLPSKLFIVDRRVALIHVTETSPDGTVVVGVLTRHPELVATLHRLFELLWEIATPLTAAPSDLPGDPATVDRELLECLLAGMKDIAIARQLGISRRTVARRVQRLLQDLNVDTRLQAGFRLGRTLSPADELPSGAGGKTNRVRPPAG